MNNKYLYLAGAFLVFGAVMFVTGRYTCPVKTVIQEKVVTKEVTKEQDETKVSDNKNENKEDKRHVHTVVTVVKKPDGTITTSTTTDINSDKTDKKTEIQYIDRVQTVVQTVEKEVEVIKTVEMSKNWAVSGLVGTSLTQFKPQLIAPYVSPLYLGIDVQRRILGPFSVGVWGMTDLGLKNVMTGVSVGVTF